MMFGVCVCMCVGQGQLVGSDRFSPSTMWALGIKLRWSGLATLYLVTHLSRPNTATLVRVTTSGNHHLPTKGFRICFLKVTPISKDYKPNLGSELYTKKYRYFLISLAI